MKKINVGVIIHIVMLLAIVTIVGLSAYKLYHWNHKATHSEPIVDTGEFDTEPEDYYVTRDVSTLEGYVDDGELNVVFLGDGLFGDYQDETGIPEQVAKITGANVYNCGFSNATMSTQLMEYDEKCGNDALSFYFVALSIANNEGYDLLRNGTRHAESGIEDYFMDTIDMMDDIDFSKVDVIVINYGVEDYLQNREIESDHDTLFDPRIFTDALHQGMRWLHAAYPNIQFVVMSPTFCFYEDKDGELHAGDVYKNKEKGTVASYMIAEKTATVLENSTFLDNYWGVDINADNAKEYFTESSKFPNEAGRKLIAEKLADTIQNRIYYKGSAQ